MTRKMTLTTARTKHTGNPLSRLVGKGIMATLMCASSILAYGQQRADRQNLQNDESFMMVVFGDPQGYTKYDINQPLYELSTAWIADNVEHLNIKAVLFTGDLIEQNENIVMNRSMLNQTSKQMWEWSSHCLERLDNKVPYIIAGGNHEYGYVRGDESFTHFPEYYTFERNSKNAEHLVSSYPNRMNVASLENCAWEFTEKHWGKLLVINTEWAPRDEVLKWAKDLCDSDKYKDHKVILLTHSLLYEKSAEYTDNENYKIDPHNWGKQVWEKLIYPCKNIRLAICGHTGHPADKAGSEEDFENNTAYRCDKNSAGRTVHQMMFNIQCLGGGWEGNGGDGWLRLLEFMPDGKTVKATTYSALFGISPMTKHLAHRTDKCCQFNMVIE